MKKVFILTQEGRAYSTEGLEIAENCIREMFGEKDELEFFMGAELNDPENLARILEENADCGYLLTSMENIGYFHPGDHFWYLAELFRKHSNENPWEVLVPIIEKGLELQGQDTAEG
ncbi:hypothetical protein [uncultured Dysosmobacter sp.]|uniref:hypothetical protein n=1 Tax=uncultured Dysosmobacter sp. TaxID=2591384 RepID=UPI0026320B4D|nr:hypothetical protein [uncultured Dysosmobacter sp.]